MIRIPSDDETAKQLWRERVAYSVEDGNVVSAAVADADAGVQAYLERTRDAETEAANAVRAAVANLPRPPSEDCREHCHDIIDSAAPGASDTTREWYRSLEVVLKYVESMQSYLKRHGRSN